jgi:hypothetical protein
MVNSAMELVPQPSEPQRTRPNTTLELKSVGGRFDRKDTTRKIEQEGNRKLGLNLLFQKESEEAATSHGSQQHRQQAPTISGNNPNRVKSTDRLTRRGSKHYILQAIELTNDLVGGAGNDPIYKEATTINNTGVVEHGHNWKGTVAWNNEP